MMTQNALDKNLTVILTLKDRVPFTYRWMAYANESRFPFRILIADGGLDRGISDALSNKNNYPDLNYEYIRYPYDETYSVYHAKKADVLDRVKTPFAVFTDNDDFLICDGLRNAMRFLMDMPCYCTCRGETYSFFLAPDLNALYGKDMTFSLYEAMSLEQKTSLERVSRHFDNYSTTYYDVHRIDDMRKYFRTLSYYDIKDVTIAELLTSFMTVASGKVKKINHPYLLRQYHLNTNCAKEDIVVDRFDRMLAESWSGDFTAFIKSVSEICAVNDNINIEDAAHHIRRGYRRFIEPVILNSILKSTAQQLPPNTSLKVQLLKHYQALRSRWSNLRKGFKTGQSVSSQNNICPELNHDKEVSGIKTFLLRDSENR